MLGHIRPVFTSAKRRNKLLGSFEKLGEALARISSFYTYLHLAEFGKSLLRLVVPLGRLILAPAWTAVGYIQSLDLYEKAKSGNALVVILGTITLILTGSFVAYRFGYRPYFMELFSAELQPAKSVSRRKTRHEDS